MQSDAETGGKWKIRRNKEPFHLKDSAGTGTSGYEPSADVLQAAHEKQLTAEEPSSKAAFKRQ